MIVLRQRILLLCLFLFSWPIQAAVTLDYWVPFSGGDARPMQMMVDEYNAKHPDVKVLMKVIRWDDYYQELNSALQQKQPPEIAVLHASSVPFYLSKSELTDLSALFKSQNLFEEFPQRLLHQIQAKDKVFALPIDIHPLVFYVNKTYLKAANQLDVNGQAIPVKGRGEFIQFLTKLDSILPNGAKAFSTPTDGILPFWLWFSLYHQQTDAAPHILNTQANFNNPQGLNAFQLLQQLRDSGLWSDLIHDERGYNYFKNGKAATMITGVWADWSFQQNKHLDFEILNFPQVFDRPANFADSHTLVIPQQNNLQKRQAAQHFLQWVAQNNLKWAESGQVPAKLSVNQSPAYAKRDNAAVFLKAVESSVFYPKHPHIKLANQVLKNHIIEFIHSNQTAEQAIKQAEQAVNKALEGMES